MTNTALEATASSGGKTTNASNTTNNNEQGSLNSFKIKQNKKEVHQLAALGEARAIQQQNRRIHFAYQVTVDLASSNGRIIRFCADWVCFFCTRMQYSIIFAASSKWRHMRHICESDNSVYRCKIWLFRVAQIRRCFCLKVVGDGILTHISP